MSERLGGVSAQNTVFFSANTEAAAAEENTTLAGVILSTPVNEGADLLDDCAEELSFIRNNFRQQKAAQRKEKSTPGTTHLERVRQAMQCLQKTQDVDFLRQKYRQLLQALKSGHCPNKEALLHLAAAVAQKHHAPARSASAGAAPSDKASAGAASFGGGLGLDNLSPHDAALLSSGNLQAAGNLQASGISLAAGNSLGSLASPGALASTGSLERQSSLKLQTNVELYLLLRSEISQDHDIAAQQHLIDLSNELMADSGDAINAALLALTVSNHDEQVAAAQSKRDFLQAHALDAGVPLSVLSEASRALDRISASDSSGALGASLAGAAGTTGFAGAAGAADSSEGLGEVALASGDRLSSLQASDSLKTALTLSHICCAHHDVPDLMAYLERNFKGTALDQAIAVMLKSVAAALGATELLSDQVPLQTIGQNLSSLQQLRSSISQVQDLYAMLPRALLGAQDSSGQDYDVSQLAIQATWPQPEHVLTRLLELTHRPVVRPHEVRELLREIPPLDATSEVLLAQQLLRTVREFDPNFFSSLAERNKIYEGCQALVDEAINAEDEYLASLDE